MIPFWIPLMMPFYGIGKDILFVFIITMVILGSPKESYKNL